MNKKEKSKQEALERIEAARKKITEERKLFAKDAPKISLQLLEGVNYTEEIVVKLKTGAYGRLDISSLGEGELLEAFSVLGMDKLQNLGEDEVEFQVEDYNFFWKLIELSTGFNGDLIKKTLAMGESSMVGQRILEISGAAGDDVEKFPKK